MYLLKNASVYTPEKVGKRDVLVIAGKIVAVEESLTVSLPGLETVDAANLILTPGLIDQHIHVTGGGGEGGPISRVPEIMLSALVRAGTTTVVGVAGTDSVTRPIVALLAKVRALTAEGISGWMYTSNYAWPPSLLSASVRDDLFLAPEVVGVKIAHSDHRSSFPTHENMMRVLSDIRVGGMIAGKPGVLHVHMGELAGGFEEFDAVIDAGIPARHIRPTHIARSPKQFEQALAFTRRGGIIDITSGGACFVDPWQVVGIALKENGNLDNVTMSTDGGGSMPRFDASGVMVGLGTGSPAANLDQLRLMVDKGGMPLETVLPLVTTNVARNLALTGKGEVLPGFDADICCFDQNLGLRHVMAKGRFLMRDGAVRAKGTFEE